MTTSVADSGTESVPQLILSGYEIHTLYQLIDRSPRETKLHIMKILNVSAWEYDASFWPFYMRVIASRLAPRTVREGEELMTEVDVHSSHSKLWCVAMEMYIKHRAEEALSP